MWQGASQFAPKSFFQLWANCSLISARFYTSHLDKLTNCFTARGYAKIKMQLSSPDARLYRSTNALFITHPILVTAWVHTVKNDFTQNNCTTLSTAMSSFFYVFWYSGCLLLCEVFENLGLGMPYVPF